MIRGVTGEHDNRVERVCANDDPRVALFFTGGVRVLKDPSRALYLRFASATPLDKSVLAQRAVISFDSVDRRAFA